MKGGMLKMNTRYESKSQREESEPYQLYGDNDRLESHSKIQSNDQSKKQSNDQSKTIVPGKLIPDNHESVYVDSIIQRENIPVWRQNVPSLQPFNQINDSLSNNFNTLPAEYRGIFSSLRY
jgi:hypothetical protein